MRSQLPVRHEMPEVETVDVPEHAAALADDLDIPEMPIERPRAAQTPFDDLDTEFAELLQEMTEGRRVSPSPSPAPRQRWEDDAPRAPAAQNFTTPTLRHESHGYAAPAAEETAAEDFRADEAHWREMQAEDERGADDFDRIDVEEIDDGQTRGRGRRGLWLASLLAGVVIVGGVGAYAVGSGGMAVNGAPALVKADAGPVKVRPQDPGGTTVPNQDNTVYERVAGAATDMPTQTKLVASAEEPVDLTPPLPEEPITEGLELSEGEDEIEALVKSEERIAEATVVEAPEPAPAEDDIVAVAPRKVRTMMVKADGTLVPREETQPEQPAAVVEPIVDAAQEAIKKAQQRTATKAPDAAPTGAIPADALPAAEPKPASIQVASLEPGAWSMQIASQPSEEGARNAYQDLAERFGNVLGSRGVNIVKAEVEGKGTYWRVRIPAESRNEAVSLCTSFKAAGGSCFVSK